MARAFISVKRGPGPFGLFFLKESRLYEAALLSGGTRSAGQPPEGFGGVMAEGHIF